MHNIEHLKSDLSFSLHPSTERKKRAKEAEGDSLPIPLELIRIGDSHKSEGEVGSLLNCCNLH